MNDERLMEPGLVTPPKEVIVLCHGEFTIDLVGPTCSYRRTVWFLHGHTYSAFPFAQVALLGGGAGGIA
jgi:hypothetical protein